MGGIPAASERLAAQSAIDPRARYVLYLHGRIVQEQGIPWPRSGRFGFYEHEGILAQLRRSGFVGESKIRPRDATIDGSVAQVANRLRGLLAGGVPAKHLTVSSASMDGGIVPRASALPSTTCARRAHC